ncbi:hypothetical protein ERX46_05155 [Brumimicrobium glaciale]|uniref:ABC-three component systems C-terminal domain-containing protein n=1 Tax=Brumimicrobium glaciale TaxID=200475 RepID=A0A4Q4KMW5_9FLAO|nr:ABC-three component system protein [Brumimicrobium glaciale]RYM34763.1 hypothetical protein ERX46_05155 [Brumimicrobium glaciale]
MSDSAKGPAAGYIYQFELALVELAKMSKDDVLSIERMDDLAIQDEKGHYILTMQAKHSISMTGSTFGSTSVDLWKTLVNWLDKLKKGHIVEGNNFIAITNVKIPLTSIVREFGIEKFEVVVDKIKNIKINQEKKIKENANKEKKSPAIDATLKRIDLVLNDLSNLKIILSKFSFKEKYQLKDDFFDSIQLGSITDDSYKSNLYDNFLGWVVSRSKENWVNENEAQFTKKDFEEKYDHLRKVHPLKKALFRNKKDIPEFLKINLTEIRSDTYIQQIEDIERDIEDKEEIVKDAVMDFILCDIEISHLITSMNTFTKPDYEDFKESCIDIWKKVKRKHAPKDKSHYSDEEQNNIAIKIFDEIMLDVKLDFMNTFDFNNSNKYVQNGTFLKLSNEPKIGWNPSWIKKYTI